MIVESRARKDYCVNDMISERTNIRQYIAKIGTDMRKHQPRSSRNHKKPQLASNNLASQIQIQMQSIKFRILSMSYSTLNNTSPQPSHPSFHPQSLFSFIFLHISTFNSFPPIFPSCLNYALRYCKYFQPLLQLTINLPFQNIFQNNPPMKRTKQDHSSNPISLSNKRNSLPTEKYNTPQKNQLTAPLQTVENNHNKSLYIHMKAELSSIKTDFERLIQREERNVGLGAKQKELIEMKNGWQTGSKGKVYSAFKSDGGAILFDRTPDIDTFEHLIKNKDVIDPNNKIFSLTKNINEAVNFKNKHVVSKDRETSNNPISKYISLNPRDNEVKQLNYASLTAKKEISNTTDRDKQLELIKMENLKQKSRIDQLEKECAGYKEESGKWLNEKIGMREENKSLKDKQDELKAELQQKCETIRADSEVIAEYKRMAEKYAINKERLEAKEKQFEELHQNILKERQQMANERSFYSQKLNELTFYNSNFYQENQILKDNISQLQRLIEDSKRINAESEKEFQRKMDYLQKNIAEYEKRERMLEAEIEKSYTQLNSRHLHVPKESLESHSGAEDRTFAEEEIIELRQQLTRQREINDIISKKYKEQLSKLNIQELSHAFQTSIQSLTDENSQLKNRRNSAQSKIQELQQKMHCYETEIALYEERERDSKASRSLSSCEWQEMTERIERLQIENKRLLEEKDYQDLRKEVIQKEDTEIAIEGKEEYNNLLQIVKDQLQEISALKEDNKKHIDHLQRYSLQIKTLRTKKIQLQDQLKIVFQSQKDTVLSDLITKHEDLLTQIQQKTRTITYLKQFLLDVISRKQLQNLSEQEQQYYASAVSTLAKV